MSRALLANDFPDEVLAARLTDAAYQAALQHGFEGSFLELQLQLWTRMRKLVSARRSALKRAKRREGATCRA